MPDRQEGSGLRGRGRECEALDRLLAGVRAGQSQVLTVRGDAGIGKTALLDYVQGRASDCRVARAAGVESEMELAFAGLHQLCAPMLGSAERLPGPQRDALATALGLGPGDVPDRFLVGLAVLGLLSEVAGERPLVCLVDDVQWLDRASAQVLGFVARRLLAEPVAMVFAVREPSDERDLVGLPELGVEGLGESDARSLLDSMVLGSLDGFVRDRIVAESRGNPLALVEITRGMTPAELEFGFARPSALPIADRIEQEFVRQVRSLPPDTQRLLLVAAVEPVGDVSVLWRAASQLGIGVDAAGPAEAMGMVTLGLRTRFRHPLVRSALRRATDVGALREVHRALAEATDPDTDPDRRAWHRAHAAAVPDEAVASELERAADRMQRRGGMVAAAAFLQRATELTPDPAQRGTRALAAARAKWLAAEFDAAMELAGTAELSPLSESQRAEIERLRASVLSAVGRLRETPEMLLETAKRLEPIDALAARHTYLGALSSATYRARLGADRDLRAIATAARNAPPAPTPPRTVDLLVDGIATLLTDGYTSALPPLRSALEACGRTPAGAHTEWLWAAPLLPPELWDDAAWDPLTTHLVAVARETGVLHNRPFVLDARARWHIHAGKLDAAAAVIDEATTISEVTGTPPTMSAALELAAWRGREADTVSSVDASVGFWTSVGNGRATGIGGYAKAVLYNGLGRYDAALAAAQQACEYEDIGFYGWSLAELVEAAERSGERAVAAAALEQLEERTRSAGTDWALGVLARSSALLGDGDDGDAAERRYVEAIERLERTRLGPELARARLLYGEWLRRANRRVDARQQLRTAYQALTSMGIDAFAERARRELAATGEKVRKRTVETTTVLTPQEAQIARLAGDHHTNPEIAAQLFISPRTVEYHLAKVFTKLDISSRRELPGTLHKLGLETVTT